VIIEDQMGYPPLPVKIVFFSLLDDKRTLGVVCLSVIAGGLSVSAVRAFSAGAS
jgi:hypothetical protein